MLIIKCQIKQIDMWHYHRCKIGLLTLIHYFLKLFSNLIVLRDGVVIIQFYDFGSFLSCFLEFLLLLINDRVGTWSVKVL